VNKPIMAMELESAYEADYMTLPLEEYEQMLEDAWHRRVFEESRGEESVKTTIDELRQYFS
jgi:hypothetical protein